MTAAQAAKQVCQNLTAEVAGIVPKGIGGWVPAWDIVAASDAEFMVALTAWEADPTEGAQSEVRSAYYAVLDAWREAVSAYEGIRQGTQ